MMGFGMAAGMEMLAVEQVQIVALYDPETGNILHLHTVTTLTGGTPPSHEDAIAEAKLHGRRRHPNADDLPAALSNDPEHGRSKYRIDPATKAFKPPR